MRQLRIAPIVALSVALMLGAPRVYAQETRRIFAGLLVGVSTLSADGRAVISPSEAATSQYKPENGVAIDVFAGRHLARYFTLQANYMWNRNDLTLVGSRAGASGSAFYEQQRRSTQHVFVADTLVYFRPLGSAIRPYLGTGLCLVRFSSNEIVRSLSVGLAPPAAAITATEIALRSHVGIDVILTRRLSARYSFSETISRNPISPHLTPTGERRLANFQNLFGFVTHF